MMRSHSGTVRSALLIAAAGIALCGCSSVLEPFVGKSKEAADRARPQLPPPAPPPTAAFVSDNDLVPGYAGHTILPPTLATEDTDDEGADTPAAAPGPHRALVAVPLTADTTALAMLNAAVKREAAPEGARFVLLALSPPAADAATLDSNTTKARRAATAAIKVLGDAGVPADHIDVSLATSPNAGDGELRLYRR